MPKAEDRIQVKNRELQTDIFDTCNVQFTSVSE